MIKKICITSLHCLVALSVATATFAQSETIDTRFAYIGDTNNDAYLGVTLGLDEANLQGKFLGYRFMLDAHTLTSIPALNVYDAIFVATESSDTLLNISDMVPPDRPVFNLTLDDNSLRQTCYPRLLHIPPSEQMLADARAQWRKKSGETMATAQAWHPTFRKYAAVQLNTRYTKLTGVAMNDTSWASWAALRMAADMITRHQKNDNIIDLLTLLRTELNFDGQKGAGMTFRDNGQLRQPVLLIKDDEIVAEAPIRGIADGLDSLGITQCEPLLK